MPYIVTKRVNGVDHHYWQPKAKYKVCGEWLDCPLPARPISSLDEGKELAAKLKRWRKGEDAGKAITEDTFDWLIVKFKESKTFKDMASSTQKNYLGHFKEMSLELGDIPGKELTTPIAYQFCTSFVDNPRKPSAIASTGRAVYQHARFVSKKYEGYNPFRELRISKPEPRKQVWLHRQEDVLFETCIANGRQDIADAAAIGLYSMQRPQDIRAAAINSYDGKWWRITQKKTGVVVEIPVYRLPKLKAVLDRLVKTPGSPVMLICKANGLPFTKETLSKGFREQCDAAGVPKDMQFRDFRRTGIVRLGEAGCTAIEISAWSGHDIESVTKILETYLPRNKTMADNAGKKIARYTKKLETAPVQSEK